MSYIDLFGFEQIPYNAADAVAYAEKYRDISYGYDDGNNPFYDFDSYGGNCTSFANQALLAGLLENDSADYLIKNKDKFYDDEYAGNAWYYKGANDRSTSWAGANQLYQYVKNQIEYEKKCEDNKGWHFEEVTHDTLTDFMDYQKVQEGDIIFADWDHDGTIDHTMIVTDIQKWRPGYNEIRVTYQSRNRTRGLGDINIELNYEALFYVYRPKYFEDGK